MRRYVVDIDEENRVIDIYKTLPEAAPNKLTVDLGDDPAKRVFAVGFLASVMELLPLAEVMPDKIEKGN